MNEAQQIMGGLEVALSAPIKAHGEERFGLTLRRPSPQEARAIGRMPYKVGADQMPVPDLQVSCEYIVLCAGIPMTSVDQLDLSDLNTLAWAVVGFFLNPASAASAS